MLALHTQDLLLPEVRAQPPRAPTGDVTLVTTPQALSSARISHSGTTRLPLPGVRDSRPSQAPRPAAGALRDDTTPVPPRRNDDPTPTGRDTAPLPPRDMARSLKQGHDPRETAPLPPRATARALKESRDPRETAPLGLPPAPAAPSARSPQRPAPSARSPQRPAPSARSPQRPAAPAEETKKVSLRRLMPGQFNARATYDSVAGVPLTGLTALAPSENPQETAAIVVVRRANQRLRGLLLSLVVLLLAGTIAGVAVLVRQHLQARALDSGAAAALEALQQRGDAAAYLQARERLRALVAVHPTDVTAQAALARTVTALRFEFGGHGSLPALTEEAQGAGYLVQAETSAAARTAQVYLALLRGDADAAALTAASLRGATEERGLADYLLGLTALLRGDAGEAAERLQAAVASAPAGGSPLRRLWLARALRDLGQEDAARDALQAALRQNPDHPGARLELAWLGAVSGRGDREGHARALRTLTRDETAGTGERARAGLALAALALQPPALSLPAARAALKEAQGLLPPEDIRLAGQLAALALRARAPELAMTTAQAALQRAPFREDIRLLLVRALLQRGRAPEALAELDRLDGRAGGARAAGARGMERERRLLRGAALLALDQTVPGQELLQALLQEEQRGKVATEARLFLLRSLQGDDLPQAQRLLAQLREGAGPETEPAALAALQEAQLQEVRLWLLSRPPRRDAALQALGGLIDRAPYLVEARLQLGRLLRGMDRAPEAAQQLREALKLDEDNAAARRELLQAAIASGDPALAQEQLAVLLQREEDDELLLLAAQARRLQGDGAGAQGYLQRVRPGRGGVTAAMLKAEREAVQRLLAGNP